MIKRILFTLVFLTTSIFISSQEERSNQASSEKDYVSSKNSVYFELLGKGLLYSFNYEREIYRIDEKLAFNGSVGFSILPGFTDIEKSKDRVLPLEINAKYSFGKHHVVLGYGTTLWKYKVLDVKIDNSNIGLAPEPTLKEMKEWFAHLVLEYRYQKPEGGLMAKAGISPLFFDYMTHSAFTKNTNTQFSINLGIGYSF